MKISKSSWHYRLWGRLSDEYKPPRDLCHYFWSIVSNIVLVLMMLAVILGIVGWLLYAIITMPIIGWVVIGFICSAIVFPIIVIGGLRKLRGSPIWMPGSDVLSEFIRAKKQRVCPLIEYMD